MGVALALSGAEFCYRYTRTAGLSPTTHPGYVIHHPRLGWAYRPGAQVRHTSGEFDVQVRINSRGFRGDEWPQPQPGRKRVLVLGDSFAFGWGVEQEQSFCSILAGLEPSWDLLNAGVSGFGTDQELLLLRELLAEESPDLVICMFCPNDLFEASSNVAYGRNKPFFEGRGEAFELTGIPVPFSVLERASYLWRAARKLLWERRRATVERDLELEWRRVKALYLSMLEELGSTPLLVLSAQDQLVELAENSPLLHFDLRPVLDELGDRAHFPIDGHLTLEGHRALGLAIRVPVRDLLGR